MIEKSPDKSLQIKIDAELKEQAEAILESRGLNITTAVRMLLKQIVRTGETPFDNVYAPRNITTPNKK
jgi:DNA-damage-inducible protein J